MERPERSHRVSGEKPVAPSSWLADLDSNLLGGETTVDFSREFVPSSLSNVDRLSFLLPTERRFLSQIQGRTYANMMAVLEGAIADHGSVRSGAVDSSAADLTRAADYARAHNLLFRRLERLIADGMPSGYALVDGARGIRRAVLAAPAMGAMAIDGLVSFHAQVHYTNTVKAGDAVCETIRQALAKHWRTRSEQAFRARAESRARDARSDCSQSVISERFRDVITAIDRALQVQAGADTEYFQGLCLTSMTAVEAAFVRDVVLSAYRLQYLQSVVTDSRGPRVLAGLVPAAQYRGLAAAFAAQLAD